MIESVRDRRLVGVVSSVSLRRPDLPASDPFLDRPELDFGIVAASKNVDWVQGDVLAKTFVSHALITSLLGCTRAENAGADEWNEDARQVQMRACRIDGIMQRLCCCCAGGDPQFVWLGVWDGEITKVSSLSRIHVYI